MIDNKTWQVYFLLPLDTVWSELAPDFIVEFQLLNEIYPSDKAAGSHADNPNKIFHCVIENESENVLEYLETLLISYDLDSDWSVEWLQSAWNIVPVIDNPGTDEEHHYTVPFVYKWPDMDVLGDFFTGGTDENDDPIPATIDNLSVYQGHSRPIL